VGISSVTIGGLEVSNSANYWVDVDGLSALMALLDPIEPRLADMAGRHPHLTGWTPRERSFSLTIGFSANEYDDRETLYLALLSALSPRYVPLTWTVNGTTRTLNVLCTEAVPEHWYKEAAVAMLAPDPTAV
jgi:hypothetical protein